jgi:hypothetical protein
LPKKCAACGNGICGKGETNQNCPQDCKYEKLTCAQACAQEGYLASTSYCNSWTLPPGQSLASTCAANEFGIGTTQDCDKNKLTAQYSDTTCCCNKQTALITEVSVWPIANSFDSVNKTFEGNIAINNNKIKIITTDNTKIYQRADGLPDWKYAEHYNFAEFQSVIKNWTGPKYPFTMRGAIGKDGAMIVDEIIMKVQ